MFGLQQGTAVLKEIHKEMGGLERVEMILSQSEEAQAYQKVRMSAVLSAIKTDTTCRR